MMIRTPSAQIEISAPVTTTPMKNVTMMNAAIDTLVPTILRGLTPTRLAIAGTSTVASQN